MTEPLGPCPKCGRPLERLAGAGMEPYCMNIRCSACPAINDDAIARIVIEMRPGVGITVNWWRHPGTSAFSALRFFHAMLHSASTVVPNVIKAGMEKLAGWN